MNSCIPHPIDSIPIVRLQAQLSVVPKTKLTIIEAPPGFGKTALGLDWVARIKKSSNDEIAWVTATNNPDDFKHDIDACLVQSKAKYCARATNPVIKVFEANEETLWLFIDDAHLLSAETIKDINDALKRFPAGAHIVLMRRPGNKCQFTSMIIQGNVNVLNSNDLAFTRFEIQSILKCSKAVASKLFDRFHGWPLAYILLARNPVNKMITANEAKEITPEHFTEFIDEEVISEIDTKLLSKICDLAALDNYKFRDAEAICKLPDYEIKMLISKLGPLWHGDVQSGYLNPVILKALRKKSWETNPKHMQALCMRASRYFWQKGELVQALSYAARSGETSYICDLIEKGGGLFLWLNEGLDSIRQVMSFTDEQLCEKYPRLMLIKSLLHVKEGDLKEADRCWAIAKKTSNNFTRDRDGGDVASLEIESQIMSFLLAVYGCHTLEDQVQAFTSPSSMHNFPQSELMQSGYFNTLLCIHALQNGSFDEVRKHASAAETAFDAFGSDYGTLFLNFHIGVVEYAEGKAKAAYRCYERAERRRRKYFSEDTGLKFIGKVLSAEVSFETGSFLSSKRKLRHFVRDISNSEAWFDIYAAGLRCQAYITYLQYGYDEAIENLYSTRLTADAKGLKRVSRYIDVIRLDLAVREGETAELNRLSNKLGLGKMLTDPRKLSSLMWREYLAMVIAQCRFLKLNNRLDDAKVLLDEIINYARDKDNKLILLYCLSAMSEINGKIDSELLSIIKATDYIAPLVLSKELRDLLSDKNIFERELQERINDDILALRPIKKTGFTKREREIIKILSRGLSDKKIAINLNVSVHTVRFHLKNIFSKTHTNDRKTASKKAILALETEKLPHN